MARLPTGTKVFLILSAALLPLALIAFFATLQTTRTADLEARARLRVAAAESSRALAIELIGDLTALRVALGALNEDPENSPSCARVQGVFEDQHAAGVRFAIRDASNRLVCGVDLPPASASPLDPDRIVATIVPDSGLRLAVRTVNGGTATALFPVSFLSEIARPTGFMPAYEAELTRAGETLILQELPGHGPLMRTERMIVGLQVDDLALEMRVRSAPITSPLLISLVLPLLMWAAAAGIAWFVVDRLLIRPLRRLNDLVARYQPGEVMEPIAYGAIPAKEILILGQTFRDISRTVQLHEADLAEGLIRQTKLTREVHHRVKNNLQVIASLINFHARSAESDDAIAAYASIQRRVDALAVVHRYHYAELEENRGVELRSVIGELASNIRATAPPASAQLGIRIDIDPWSVSQDVAVAVAFLITELLELAMKVNPVAQITISVKPTDQEDQAVLRVSSPALAEGPTLNELLDTRYGRVISGLVRQLRSQLHHDPLVGAYETTIAILGRP